MFRTVSMPLREFCSNNVEVIEQLFVDKRAPNLNETKLLGLIWKTSEDEFVIRFPGTPCEPLTKRSLLAKIASVFDPMWIVSPTLLKAKLLFSQLWDLNFTWDKKLPPHFIQEWESTTNVWINYRLPLKRPIGHHRRRTISMPLLMLVPKHWEPAYTLSMNLMAHHLYLQEAW